LFICVKCENPELLLNDYNDLIEQKPREQEVQEFLENNTHLLPREFVQNHGIHFSLCLRKVRFGSEYISDFMYLSKSTASWNCVLIEIEKPQSKYFKGKEAKYHSNFADALQQINDWRAWFSTAGNKEYFFGNSIGFLKTPISHTQINMKYVLVHGRRSEFETNLIRLNKVNSEQRDDFRIMSFDSLAEDLSSKNALYIGAKKKEHIEIMSDQFVDESLFGLLDPSQIKINEELATDMARFRGKINSMRFNSSGESVRSVDYYLDERAQ